MKRHSRIKIRIVITTVLIVVTLFTAVSPVAANYNYWFQPNPYYTQSDVRAILHIDGFNGPPYPARVDWTDPQGNQVYCVGGQGVCWDQQVADNGILVWKDFYLPIAGYNRLSGSYNANAYSYESGIYTYMFSLGFSIELLPITDGAELDPAFGKVGKVTTDLGGGGAWSNAVALQTDGKIVAAGENSWSWPPIYAFALVRYNRDGSLDTGFGAGGMVINTFSGNDRARSVALQADGKIVVAGTGYIGGTENLVLARYNSDGSLDAGFGADGKVAADFGGDDSGNSVVVQKDGKIVAAGGSCSGYPACDFAMVRYNTDGSLDPNFGAGGKETTDFGGLDLASSVVLQADGKIVVLGTTSRNNSGDFALARYNSDGSLDMGFGTGGKVVTDFGGDDGGRSAAVQKDGKIVAAVGRSSGLQGLLFSIVRYNSDGSLDSVFGSGGKVTTDFGGLDYSGSIVLQTGGKIVVAGTTSNPVPASYFALARYNSDGSLDTGFGVGGKATTRFVGSAHSSAAAVQADNKIVVAGGSGDYFSGFALARYVALVPLPRHIYMPLVAR